MKTKDQFKEALAHIMPCTMLWQSVLYRMIALDEKEDGDGESV